MRAYYSLESEKRSLRWKWIHNVFMSKSTKLKRLFYSRCLNIVIQFLILLTNSHIHTTKYKYLSIIE